MKEIECLNELRENNQKKRLDSSSTYCICEKLYSDSMVQCDLCNEYYHRMLNKLIFFIEIFILFSLTTKKVIVYLIMEPMSIPPFGGFVIFVFDHDDHVFKMSSNYLEAYRN